MTHAPDDNTRLSDKTAPFAAGGHAEVLPIPRVIGLLRPGTARAARAFVSTLTDVSSPICGGLGSPTPTRTKRTSGNTSRNAAGYQQPENLTDQELLQTVLLLVLGTRKRPNQPDARETASQLLDELCGLGGLGQYLHVLHHPAGEVAPAARRRAPELTAFSTTELNYLATIVELGRRVCRSPLVGLRLRSHDDVQAWATGRLTDLEHEEVWVLAVTSSSRVVAQLCVGKGGLHGCGLLPSDILRPVLRAGAPALTLVHNHPSGDPTPSREDVAMTKTLHLACKAIGVILLDHVIVSRNGSYSLAEGGLY